MGANLPSEEIGAVASHLSARVVAPSIVYPNDDLHLKLELKKFKHLLPDGVSIIVGGRANGYYDILDEIGALVVKDSRHLRLELEAIRENKYD